MHGAIFDLPMAVLAPLPAAPSSSPLMLSRDSTIYFTKATKIVTNE
jgi:hypothetical protein